MLPDCSSHTAGAEWQPPGLLHHTIQRQWQERRRRYIPDGVLVPHLPAPGSPHAWEVRKYPWGDAPCNSTTCPPAITSARGLPPGTHAYDKLPDVGSFPGGASAWGLLDMAGVVPLRCTT